MSDNFRKDDEALNEHWLSSWEQQAVDGWESDSSLEERIQVENEKSKQKLWTSFQNSASSISQLYKGSFSSYLSEVILQVKDCLQYTGGHEDKRSRR